MPLTPTYAVMPMVLVGKVADLLHANTLGVKGIDLFQWALPPSPADAMTVYGSGGASDAFSPLSTVRVQVLVRRRALQAALSVGDAVWRLLHRAVIQDGALSGRLMADHMPMQPFLDSNNFFLNSLNFVFIGTRVG